MTFYVNQNVQDPVLREIFQTPKFRYALSLAINREEVASLVFHNLGEPRQASLISGVAFMIRNGKRHLQSTIQKEQISYWMKWASQNAMKKVIG